MIKPIIAITVEIEHDAKDERTHGRLQCNRNYTQEIARAGGVPLLIPPDADMEAVAEVIDGWLIPGGDDLDASHFGEENNPNVSLGDPDRFLSETRLFAAVSKELPILGICYGCQCINVLRGGTLIQHLPDQLGHNNHAAGDFQEHNLKEGSQLAALMGAEKVSGRSYHHQATGQLADSLEVVARAEDGTVEGLEAKDRPFMVGVQWHPERTPEDEATINLFRGFIQAARLYRQSRETHAPQRIAGS